MKSSSSTNSSSLLERIRTSETGLHFAELYRIARSDGVRAAWQYDKAVFGDRGRFNYDPHFQFGLIPEMLPKPPEKEYRDDITHASF